LRIRSKDQLRQGEGDEAYYTRAEETDDAANKVSQRPEGHSRKGAHSKSIIYLADNYRLQGGNLQAKWY